MLVLELLLRGGLVLLIVLMVEPLLRHRATLRHVLLTSALCVLILQPIQLLTGIEWRPPLLPALAPIPETTFEPAPAANSTPQSGRAAPVSSTPAEELDGIGVVAAIYLSGLTLLIALRLVSMLRIHRQVACASVISDSHAAAGRARSLACQQRVGRRVALRQSAERIYACTAGLWRPVIVLPAGFDSWSDSQLDAVLRHELVHVRRYDTVWRLVSDLAVAIHWFNPLVWWLAQRCTYMSERACDSEVVLSGMSAQSYAEALRDLAIRAQPAHLFQPEPSAACSDLRRRIEHLLAKHPHSARKRDLGALAMLTVAIGLPIGLCTPARVQATFDEIRVREFWQLVTDATRPFAERIAALERATRAGLRTAGVVSSYANIPDDAMRARLIAWLAQRDNEIARAHLIEIVSGHSSAVERQAALAGLEASVDARAREYALRQREPMPGYDPAVAAMVIDMMPRSLSDHIAEQTAAQPSDSANALTDAIPCALPVRARPTDTLSTADFTGEARTSFGPGESIHLIARFTDAIPREADRVQFVWIDPAGRVIVDGSDIVNRRKGAPAVGIALTTGASSSANSVGIWRALACYQSGGVTRALDTVSFTVR